jgi:hypothetical protein
MTAALQTPMTNFFLDANVQQSASKGRGCQRAPKFGLAVENFGIPWSFTHGLYEGTNTCAMDTVLMTLFVFMKTAGIHEVVDSSLTRRTMALIEEEKYAEASFFWLTENMKKPNTPGRHNCWSGIDANVCSVACKKLFEFTTTYESSCGSDFCPLTNGHHGDTKGYEGIYTACVSQSYNSLLMDDFFSEPQDARCHLPVTRAHAAGCPDGVFANIVEGITIDGDPTGDKYVANQLCCAGTRRFQPRRMLVYPTIFRVYSYVGLQEAVQITKKPAATLRLFDRDYNLGAEQ